MGRHTCGLHGWRSGVQRCAYCEAAEQIKQQEELVKTNNAGWAVLPELPQDKPQPNEPNKKFVDTYNYNHRRKVLINYLRIKLDVGDWAAVSTAANDLRVLEAENK